GVSRTISLTYRDILQFVSASSDFSSETISAGIDYSYPITEYQYLRFGLTLQSAEILTNSIGSAIQAQEWVGHNGNSFTRIGEDFFGNQIEFTGTEFKTAELLVGWTYNTLNRALFPTAGTRHTLALSYTAPGSDVEYW